MIGIHRSWPADRVVLGPRRVATSELYGDRDLQEAIRIAREAG